MDEEKVVGVGIEVVKACRDAELTYEELFKVLDNVRDTFVIYAGLNRLLGDKADDILDEFFDGRAADCEGFRELWEEAKGC